jgi:phenylalanyl-tRNA synthetase alpha chain
MSQPDLAEVLKRVRIDARHAFDAARTEDELLQIKAAFLGRQGALQPVMQQIKHLDPAGRPAAGLLLNEAKQDIEAALEDRRASLRTQARERALAAHHVDLTLPPRRPPIGAAHPLVMAEDAILDVFAGMGYDIAEGPQVETDFHNFEALNFPHDHPARDMQDTFMVPGGFLLRTHTSPVQVRTLASVEPPLRIAAPGPVFRCDTTDMTHSPNFRQVEGLVVDRHISMAHLRGTLQEFSSRLFGRDLAVRMRPSFFPFTEPSVEVDVECPFCREGCRICKQSRWIEILGAGMVHPRVLEAAGVDPGQWRGFAFGIGVERVAMMLYGVEDIRFFYENDIRFLNSVGAPQPARSMS